jgi:predicted DNA-binding transcriptional regulator AlpA
MTGFMTIQQFLQASCLKRSTLYRLWSAGTGPRFTKIGKRRLISAAAADEWCAEVDGRHAETTKPPLTLAEAQRGRRR